MVNYNTILCPMCGKEIRRELLENVKDSDSSIMQGEMGVSQYFCYSCQHYVHITHFLNDDERFNLQKHGGIMTI